MESHRTGKVFIVEDSPAVRSRLVELVAAIEGMSVVGEAVSPEEAIAGIRATRPDCVVLDFQLIDGTAVDVLRAMHSGPTDIAFIVLTNHPTAQHRRVCMEAGASRFLDKSTEFGRLKEVVTECVTTRC